MALRIHREKKAVPGNLPSRAIFRRMHFGAGQWAAKANGRERFAWMLNKIEDENVLKESIMVQLARNDHSSSTEQIYECVEKAFAYLKKYCGESRRKDGRTPNYLHPMTVGYYTAMFGYGLKDVLSALLHDVVEDAQKFGRTKAQVRKEIRTMFWAGESRLGGEVLKEVEALSRKQGQSVLSYIRSIFDANEPRRFMKKFFDNIANLNNLEGCEEGLKISTIEKALQYVKILKKIHKDMFEIAMRPIKEAAPQSMAARISKIEDKSFRQFIRESWRIFVVVNMRRTINLDLLRSVPDNGSPTVTVYVPETDLLEGTGLAAKNDYFEVELPHFVGSLERAKKMVNAHVYRIEFEQSESRLTELAASTYIFKAEIPPREEWKRTIAGLNRLTLDLKAVYGSKTRVWPFVSGVVRLYHEL